MIYDMNKKKLFLWILCLIFVMPLWAQKKSKLSKTQVITEEERRLSSDYADGLIEMNNGNDYAAEIIFRKILHQKPDHDATYYILGELYQQRRNDAEAVHYFKEAVALNPENPYYRIALATTYESMKKFDSSVLLWKVLVKEYPENETYRYYYNNALLNLGKLTEVIKFYDDFEKKYGLSEEGIEIKKNIYVHFNQLDKAALEVDKLIKKNPSERTYYLMAGDLYFHNIQYDKALKYYQKMIVLDSLDFDANLKIIQLYKAQQKSIDFYPYLYKLVLSPDLEIGQFIPLMEDYLKEMFKTGFSQDSIQLQRTEILMDMLENRFADVEEVWLLKAVYHTALKDYKQAIVAYEEVLKIDNAIFAVWEGYLNVLMHELDFEKILSYEKILNELFPINVQISCILAETFYGNEQYEQSIFYYEKASKETFDNTLLSYIYSGIGESYYRLNDKAKTFEYYEKALKKNSRNTIVLNNYAYYLSLEGQALEKAKTMAMKLTDLEGGNPVYQDTYAWVLYRCGDVDNAKIWIDKAMKSGGSSDEDVQQHYREIMNAFNR